MVGIVWGQPTREPDFKAPGLCGTLGSETAVSVIPAEALLCLPFSLAYPALPTHDSTEHSGPGGLEPSWHYRCRSHSPSGAWFLSVMGRHSPGSLVPLHCVVGGMECDRGCGRTKPPGSQQPNVGGTGPP